MESDCSPSEVTSIKPWLQTVLLSLRRQQKNIILSKKANTNDMATYSLLADKDFTEPCSGITDSY